MIAAPEFDLFALAQRCHSMSAHIAETLQQALIDEAHALTAEGFVVLAPEAIKTACEYFAALAKSSGHESALRNDIPIAPRINLILALASGIRDFEAEFDIAWSAQWDTWRRHGDNALAYRRAIDVLNLWNGGGEKQVRTAMQRDLDRHYKDEVWRL